MVRALFRPNNLKALGILYSNAHLLRLEASGEFPRRVHTGKGVGRIAWYKDEIEEYLATRTNSGDFSPQRALSRAVERAAALHPNNIEAARQALSVMLTADARVMWEFCKPFRDDEMRRLLRDVVAGGAVPSVIAVHVVGQQDHDRPLANPQNSSALPPRGAVPDGQGTRERAATSSSDALPFDADGKTVSPTHERAARPTAAAGRGDRTAGFVAGAAWMKRWLIDTFLINNTPLGDVTVGEALDWADAQHRNARFIKTLLDGLPPERKVRDVRTAEDVEAVYERVMQESRI